MAQIHFLILLFNYFISTQEATVKDYSDMNIVMFNIEDLTTEALPFYGNKIVKTPHLDKLASEGVLFKRAYCQGPICGPSRSSFTTGLRPETNNVFHNMDCLQEVAPPRTKALAHYLNNDRVWVANIGKLFHADFCARDMLAQFDQLEFAEYEPEGFEGVFNSFHKKEPPKKRFIYSEDQEIENALIERRKVLDTLSIPRGLPGWWEKGGGAFHSLNFELTGDVGYEEEYTSDGQKARAAATLISKLAEEKRQFFISLGLSAPHVPLTAPKKYVEIYDPETIPLPQIKSEDDVNIPPVAKRFGRKTDLFQTRQVDEFPQLAETPERVKEVIASYYACVSFMDAQVGLVLDALEEAGIADNTIVIFFSDHGFHLGEHGLWSKRSMFEQSTRVPMIVKLPGAKGNGKSCDEIVELVDVLPTMVDFWDVQISEQDFEGLSFAPLLENPEKSWKKAAFTTARIMGNMSQNVRTKRYRFTKWEWDGNVDYEFYDLKNDPNEQHNLYENQEYKFKSAELQNLLNKGWKAALP